MRVNKVYTLEETKSKKKKKKKAPINCLRDKPLKFQQIICLLKPERELPAEIYRIRRSHNLLPRLLLGELGEDYQMPRTSYFSASGRINGGVYK